MADSIFGMFSFQESSDEYHSPPLIKKSSLQGVPWKDFSKGNFSFGREEMGRTSTKHGDKSDSVRKSKRVPKRRVLDGEFDEDDEDDEIRYLEKLKTSKMSGFKDLEAQSTRKVPKGVKNETTEDFGRRDSKKPRSGDTDYEEEEETFSDGDNEGKKKRSQKKDLSELPTENKREIALTTRQRALLSKDAPASGPSQVEFPNGLPPAPPRSQYECLFIMTIISFLRIGRLTLSLLTSMTRTKGEINRSRAATEEGGGCSEA